MTLTLTQFHRGARKQNLHANYLKKFSIDLDWIWLAVGSCLSDKPLTCFIVSHLVYLISLLLVLLCSISIQRRKLYLGDFVFKKNQLSLAFTYLQTDLFQVCADNRRYWAIYIDTSLKDLQLHSRSQFCEKAEMSVLFFWQIPQSVSMKFSFTAMTSQLF